MIHTDGKRTIANSPRATGKAVVARTTSGKLVLVDAKRPEDGWKLINAEVKEATALG